MLQRAETARENALPRKTAPAPPLAMPNMASVDSRPGTASLPVRPVTARTWQALLTEEAGKQVSLYTNDLFGQLPASDAAPEPASARYRPSSARPAFPATAERLQQPPTATSPRPQASLVRMNSPSRLAMSARDAATTVAATAAPTAPVPASSAQVKSETSTQPHNVRGARPPADIQGSAALTAALSPTSAVRPSTASVRTSTVALRVLAGAGRKADGATDSSDGTSPGAEGSSAASLPMRSVIALDSPRLRQLLGQNFASAVPAGGTSSPRQPPGIQGAAANPESISLRQQYQQARPSTPSFQPIVTAPARPATAAGGAGSDADTPSVAEAGPNFTIAANRRDSHSMQRNGPRGAYPVPPSTAPAKAPLALPGGNACSNNEPKSGFAAFGISLAAFLAASGRRGADGSAGAAVMHPPMLSELLASASQATHAGLHALLLAPGPADKPMQCRIMRNKGGLLKGGTQYTLVLDEAAGSGRFLLAARKCTGMGGGARYVISHTQDDFNRNGAGCCGKVRSNFLGTEFVGCAAGGNELVAVTYQTNVLGTKGPRKMTAIIPKLAQDGARPLPVTPSSEAESLLGQYRQYALTNSVVLRNKPPRWNEGLGAYCLSFGGRVSRASVKNFQLVAVDNMERVVLQFGKVADEAFTMDYAYPVTALQAFAICISSLSSKMACE